MAKNPRNWNLGIQRFELVSTSLTCCWFDSRSGSRLLHEESGNLSSHVILTRKAKLAGMELQSLHKQIVKESILKSLGEQRNWEFQIGLSKGEEQLSQRTCYRWIQRSRGVLVGQRIWRRHYHILAERMLTRGCKVDVFMCNVLMKGICKRELSSLSRELVFFVLQFLDEDSCVFEMEKSSWNFENRDEAEAKLES